MLNNLGTHFGARWEEYYRKALYLKKCTNWYYRKHSILKCALFDTTKKHSILKSALFYTIEKHSILKNALIDTTEKHSILKCALFARTEGLELFLMRSTMPLGQVRVCSHCAMSDSDFFLFNEIPFLCSHWSDMRWVTQKSFKYGRENLTKIFIVF